MEATSARATRVTWLDPKTLQPAEVEAWDRLSGRAVEPNPFLRPDFALPALIERGHDAELLVVREGPEWLACLAVRRAARWGRIPVPCLVPWMPDAVFLATPLLDAAALDRAAAAGVEAGERERRAAALVLDLFDPDGPAGAALVAAAQARGVRSVVARDFERGALRRRPEETYLAEAVGTARRKSLRKSRRRLSRELGAEPVLVDRSDEPAAWDAFLAMEAAGWKGAEGTAIACTEGDAAFFRSMCSRMAAEGRLQMLALEGGGRTVAMQCNLIDRDVAYAFKIAYDEALAAYSPGVLLEVAGFEYFHRETPAVLADSCATPDNAFINELWPDRRRLQTLLLLTPAPHSRLVPPALRAEGVARRAWRRARRRPAVSS